PRREGVQTVATRWRKAWGPVLVAVLLWAAAAGLAQAQGASEKAGETGGSREPVFLDIFDEDALLLVTRSEGRDVVRVLGGSQVAQGVGSSAGGGHFGGSGRWPGAGAGRERERGGNRRLAGTCLPAHFR